MMIAICDDFNVMPKSGGLFDQDYLFIQILQYVLEWRETKRQLDESKVKAK